jgi:hypothetical protein
MHAPQVSQADVERYVGIPYREGEYDCADLVQQALRELLHIEIALPADRTRFRHPSSMIGEIVRWRPLVARRRFDRSEWRSGDGVLLCVGESSYPTHVGLLFDLAGEWWVLHNDQACRASVLTLLRRMREIGFRLDGVYGWKPRPPSDEARAAMKAAA